MKSRLTQQALGTAGLHAFTAAAIRHNRTAAEHQRAQRERGRSALATHRIGR